VDNLIRRVAEMTYGEFMNSYPDPLLFKKICEALVELAERG
jgi:hypothetical protein